MRISILLSVQLMSAPGNSSLDDDDSANKKWDIVGRHVLHTSSTLQVMNGIMLILLLFTARRNFIMLLIYWQLLQFRCTMELHALASSRPLLDAFAALDRQIMGLIGSYAVVVGLYVKVKTMMRSSIEPRDASAATRPSCAIM